MKVLIINHHNRSLNGMYYYKKIDNVDKNTLSFYKDNKHQLYRYNNIWRIAEYGKKIHLLLNERNNKKWNIKLLDIGKYNKKNLDKKNLGKIVVKQNKKILNICFCSDENLINFIPVVINSILRKNSHHMINIHYINNIKDKNKIKTLEKYVLKFKNLSFKSYYKEWNYKYNGLKHVSVATMLRIFIPEIIKKSRVLYLDIDIIVNIDLMKLYKIDCGKTGIALKNSIHKVAEKYFTGNKKSGNCGIIMMDLNTLRKNNFTNKCLKIHSKNSDRHDQYVINMYSNGKHTVLKPEYNIYLNQDDHLVKINKDFILHYAGSKKPYYTNVGKYQYLWNKNK